MHIFLSLFSIEQIVYAILILAVENIYAIAFPFSVFSMRLYIQPYLYVSSSQEILNWRDDLSL